MQTELEKAQKQGSKPRSRRHKQEPSSQQLKAKRKIIEKLGYKGPNSGEKIPDEIFQMLWLIQQNEAKMFVKNARDYAQVRILDRPKKRLDAMIDLRMEILKIVDSMED